MDKTQARLLEIIHTAADTYLQESTAKMEELDMVLNQVKIDFTKRSMRQAAHATGAPPQKTSLNNWITHRATVTLLNRVNLYTVEDVQALSKQQLLKLPGIGPRTWIRVANAFRERGVTLA